MKAKRKPSRKRDGQVLVAVLVILLVVSTFVPLMVYYTQWEAQWTDKQARTTMAFHMAESGIEKGYLALSLSTKTWRDLQNGTQISGYKGDTAYTDVAGGSYVISITSGPDTEQATVISIGRDPAPKQVRAIKAVYTNSTLGGVAIMGSGGVTVSGGVEVHWGAVVSPQALTLGSALTYPSFYSASSISPYDTDPALPNCDSQNCQWHSYYPGIPPEPVIDLQFYKSSAQATGTYYTTAQSWTSYDSTNGSTVYVDNNLTVGSPGVDINGTLIVTGNLTTTSGNWGKGSRSPRVPRTAWKQYCNAWSTYQPMDTTEPFAFPGLTSSYKSPDGLTYTPSPNGKFAVSGLMYVQGTFSIGGGGGGSYLQGSVFILGTSTIGAKSSVTIFYDEEASRAVQTTQLYLVRESWQDVLNGWPSGVP